MQITQLAIEKAKEALLDNSGDGKNRYSMIRIGLKGGGCSGYSYIMEFETNKRSKDIVQEYDGLIILIDPKSDVFLKNVTLDYETKLIERGFKFINPDMKSECGCKKSFSI